ncbi:unnamed protein product [Chironomus riparius]|uniref:Uncharacterized protein n=1 Tax=Chironomus riparius TaxID=315576 RepID=A0A9P0IVE3_9DIPT|nr:unnamed protein product [Chironomus riparius]
MHHRKLFLVIFISLIHSFYAVRVDTNVVSSTEKSESVDDQLPKAEALTLVIHKHVPLRPFKVIERKDDVVVIHTNGNRNKRKPSTRRRRPSNQYRSKIRSSSNPSHFGGFKDFSSNDSRFPPFPSKNFRASSPKVKNGPPPKSNPSYDYNPKSRRPPKRPPTKQLESVSPSYGPPTINHIDSHFVQPVTLQQQQHNFPTFTINALEPASSNFYSTNDVTKYSPAIGNFPLSDGSSFDVQKTSYGEPIKSASTPDTSSYQFNSNVASILNQINKNNQVAHNFPKLPSKYEESEFSTPIRHNPLNSNSFTSDFSNIDLGDSKNVLSTSNTQKNRFNKFNNYDYDFRNHKNPLIGLEDDGDDEYDNLEYTYSTTTRRPRTTKSTTTTTEFSTTRRYNKKGAFGKRNRGKLSQEHNLDTDDLRDAFTESTNNDFHEIALNSDDFLNFDSQRNHRKSSSPSQLHEIHSTLKAARRNPALRQALGDDFQIVSIQKSLEKDPRTEDLFQRRHDTQRYREFHVGGEINFSQSSPVMWNGEMNNFPRNHKFSS